MSNTSIDTLVNYVIDTFDHEEQGMILIEEMSELTKEILKRRRKKNNHAEIVEEFTHVLVSMQVNKIILGITDDEINEEIRKKFKEYNINI